MAEKLPVIEVPIREGKHALMIVKRKGVLDESRKVCSVGDKLVIPVTEDGNSFSDSLPFKEKIKSPQERISRDIEIPYDLKQKLPSRYERIGDVLFIKLDESLIPYKDAVGKAYGKELGMKTVAIQGDIEGKKREPNIEAIYGEETETTHLENGVRFKLDTAKIMFSSGNIDERIHMAKLDLKGEVIVDMFSGIGYFGVPMAVHGQPYMVYALEINPVAHGYLKENCIINDVEEIVEPILGDNRDFKMNDHADRVVMGYLHDTWKYLYKACEFLKGSGIIHYHTLVREGKLSEDVKSQLSKAGVKNYEVLNMRNIKSYAPRIYHVVADIEIN